MSIHDCSQSCAVSRLPCWSSNACVRLLEELFLQESKAHVISKEATSSIMSITFSCAISYVNDVRPLTCSNSGNLKD